MNSPPMQGRIALLVASLSSGHTVGFMVVSTDRLRATVFYPYSPSATHRRIPHARGKPTATCRDLSWGHWEQGTKPLSPTAKRNHLCQGMLDQKWTDWGLAGYHSAGSIQHSTSQHRYNVNGCSPKDVVILNSCRTSCFQACRGFNLITLYIE